MRLPAQFQPLLAEWRANPRLQVAGWLILGILLLYFALVFSDLQDEMASEYRAAQQRLQKMQSLSGQSFWLQRARDAHTTRLALEAGLEQADTLGLAQASMQTWLQQILSGYGGAVRISPGTPSRVKASQDSLWRIPMTIAGTLPPRDVLTILQQLESRKQLITIESSLMNTGANPTFTLTLQAYYRIQKPPVEGGGS